MLDISQVKRSAIYAAAVVGVVVALFPASAAAVTQQIRAVFYPDASNPQFNKFENRTPLSGFCLDNPPQCKAENLFSLRLPILSYSNATIVGGHTNKRLGAMFNIPSQWQDVTVSHPTAPPQTVRFRVAGMGVAYTLPLPAPELTGGLGHNYLFEGGTWSYAGPPCTGLLGAGNDIGFNSFWRHPVSAGICAKKAVFDIPQPFKYETFDITYELDTPNPQDMVSGQYTGQHIFRVGPSQDFDLGDVMIPQDDVIVLDFLLDVEHVLKVDIPPGGEKIQLVPAGGWQSWLHGGRKPVRLFRDQTFNISASSRFKMFLQCSISDGRVCLMADRDSMLSAPLKVSVSLPGGLTDSAGRPVQRQELVTEGGAVTFQPSHYVDRKPGTLHFELEKPDHFFLPGAPKQYFGGVTVIWDSEI
ncbi:hypothetical protein PS893_04346 [Pseudomonas fluorescens]|jgi:hypothetical protein|uniref:hypothetical protein n=1 Tax=Pseudomonas TaxID=286 RepID=UPI000F900C08|nr:MULTISPECIES: hypothetical protein [Pseudomonas]QHF42085.1 hypothetical protein PspS34_05110 [Pseudomonas sp. S34]VVP30996.1 hypothetical protein PS893_04346 [Pseudomonas fluorescens]